MIYIHIPYCRSFCTYCGFYSELAGYNCNGFEPFTKALCNEIKERYGEFGNEVNTLYLGGGTPSVLPLSAIRKIVSCLHDHGAKAFSEFTMEVNPDDIVRKGLDYVRGLADLGVNRVSMGVQSFDASLLRWMNRRHGPDDAVRACEMLREGGIHNVSMDLIFGVGNAVNECYTGTGVQDRWKFSLNKMLSLKPSHISAYQLSVEEGSTLESLYSSGRWSPSSEEESAREYEDLCEILKNAGYHHYEISNFAIPGFEAEHNSAYWRHIPYTGLGPGAHSFIISDGRYIRRWNNPRLSDYIDVMSGNSSVAGSVRCQDYSGLLSEADELDGKIFGMEILDEEQIVLEKIMLSLRTDAGIGLSYLVSHISNDKLTSLLDKGLLVMTSDGNVRIPEDRFFVSDNIVSSLF